MKAYRAGSRFRNASNLLKVITLYSLGYNREFNAIVLLMEFINDWGSSDANLFHETAESKL